MKFVFTLLSVIFLISCKQEKSTKKEDINGNSTKINTVTKSYPENLLNVFKAHGGIDAWHKMQTLVFTKDSSEIITTHLKNRKTLIDMPKHTIGYDGKDVWLIDKDTMSYKGNARFYYNLMFYFYTMPFVLGDDGINYSDVEVLKFQGKTYPGIKISYVQGIGASSTDEYILYYDPETYQMTWLAYTMTYFSKKPSQSFNYIKYDTWQQINGILLPKTIQWYNVVDGKLTDRRNEVIFTHVSLLEEEPKGIIFSKPDHAEIVE